VLITVLVISAAVIGWLAAHLRAQRVIGERDRALAVAEARLAGLDQDKFVTLAQRAFQQVGESLVRMSKTQVDGSLDTKKAEIAGMLTPVREMLDQYRGEVQKSERARVEAYGGLQEQIRSLLTSTQSAQREASRLANALQSPTVRGSWGEASLRRCVELAGMSEFCDFDTQLTFAADDGRRVRPDLIVRLPNNRVIAIDAKVPLSDYTVAANETEDKRRADALDMHARTVRRHVESLSRREYHAAIGETLDFVVLFVPGEHFLSAALMTDPTIFDFAAAKRVYLASATVLLPLLRAVHAGWKAERTEENAKKMHEAGVELFNRFVKVMELFSDLGATLAKTVEKYNGVIRSIDSRLWPKGEEMQRMAGSGKDLAAPSQIEAVPLESSKLRLTMQHEEPADVLPFRE